MSTVTAIFASPAEAEDAMHVLRTHGFDERQINALTRGESSFREHGKGGGTAIGGITGQGLATFLPGLGPVLGVGTIATALIGTALGSAARAAIDRYTHGIPNEDLYFYEEAIRNGNALVIVDARDSTQETQARNLLERAGSRPVQGGRRAWWLALQDRECDYLRSRGQELGPIEADYRSGFEAALHPTTRGRDYDDVVAYIETCYPGPCRTAAFRVGYDRGQNYFRERMQARELE